MRQKLKTLVLIVLFLAGYQVANAQALPCKVAMVDRVSLSPEDRVTVFGASAHTSSCALYNFDPSTGTIVAPLSLALSYNNPTKGWTVVESDQATLGDDGSGKRKAIFTFDPGAKYPLGSYRLAVSNGGNLLQTIYFNWGKVSRKQPAISLFPGVTALDQQVVLPAIHPSGIVLNGTIYFSGENADGIGFVYQMHDDRTEVLPVTVQYVTASDYPSQAKLTNNVYTSWFKINLPNNSLESDRSVYLGLPGSITAMIYDPADPEREFTGFNRQ